MPTPVNIPDVTYGSYFGNVGKVVWYDVSNNFNYFELFFSINLKQFKQTSLVLLNNKTNSVVWERIYPADADQEVFLDSIKILYIPEGVLEQPFGLINQPT